MLFRSHELTASIGAVLDDLEARIVTREAEIERIPEADEVESANAELLALRDAVWAVRRDRLRTAAAVGEFAGRDAGDAAVAGYLAVQQALSAIDRMEVRGRDSAGIHLFVWQHALDLHDPAIAAQVARRSADPLFQNGSVRVVGDRLGFVYKAAAEIGELGDNVRALRAAVQADDLLRLALSGPEVRVSVIGHTRWASVGIISEPNCHPVNGEQSERSGGDVAGYTVAVLNGDVDNHADIKVRNGLRIADPITTDAKVIPTVVARRRQTGEAIADAFRNTVREFDGSVAIAAASAESPSTMLLALRGSGQGLCVGLAEDRFIVASEPYGCVEETLRYVRMDGEALADVNNPATRGQVVILDGERAGTLDGCQMMAYDGTSIQIGRAHV